MTEAERIAQAYRSRDPGAIKRWDLANAGNRRILAERRRLTTRLLERAAWLPLGERRVLDVGSGTGAELAWFREVGARDAGLVGIDLLPERVAAARQAYPGLEFHAGSAERLPFPDSSFDVVVACTLFSSILEEGMAKSVAGEIGRVIRPGGGLLWYDFRYDSPSNPNVRGVGERRVRSLFPGLTGELILLTLLPPLARRLGPLTAAAYPVLAAIPPLRSHLLGLLRKAA